MQFSHYGKPPSCFPIFYQDLRSAWCVHSSESLQWLILFIEIIIYTFSINEKAYYFLLIALLCDELLVSIWIDEHRASPSSRLELPTGLKVKIERILKRTALKETIPHTQHEALVFHPSVRDKWLGEDKPIQSLILPVMGADLWQAWALCVRR